MSSNLSWLTKFISVSASTLEFGCWSSYSLIGVSVDFLCRSLVSLAGCLPSRLLSWPAGLRMAVMQSVMHDLRGPMVAIMEVLGTLVGKVPVETVSGQTIPSSAALWLDRLQGLHDMKVGHILVCQLGVLWHVDILFGHIILSPLCCYKGAQKWWCCPLWASK